MKRIGCILLILTIILTGCKTGNKNKNDKAAIELWNSKAETSRRK